MSKVDLRDMARRGVEFCRSGEWDRGLRYLSAVATSPRATAGLDPVEASFVGLALARGVGRPRQGLEVCRWSVEQRSGEREPEAWLNLARVSLHLGLRGDAWNAVQTGLRWAPGHAGLIHFENTHFVVRRRPPLPFLERSHPFNRWIGQVSCELRRGLQRAS